MSNERTFIVIVIIAAITILLRALPFLIFAGRETPKIILYFGRFLPCAIMGMLVVYCLKDISFESVSSFLPEFIASLVVILSYIVKKNTLISIILGTLCYMLLVQFIFI